MRITGGKARGIPIHSGASKSVRPATDKIRQALFSGECVRAEDTFLDLFAGTGAYGLEAISHGMMSGVFVEKDRRCLVTMKRNLAAVCKSAGQNARAYRVQASDVFRWKSDEGFDWVFMDPPYPIIEANAPELFALAYQVIKKHEGARLVFEMPGELDLCPGEWTIRRSLGKKGRGEPKLQVYGLASL